MSNLLEKASILTTPTAYDNGKLLSVKPAKPYSDEITVNGNFATDSDWTKDAGWTISNGEAIHTGSGSYISQTGTTIGKNYKVVIEVTQASGSGFPQIYMGGLTTAMTSAGTYTFDITATSTLIRLRGVNDCKVTSISVKEVLHADFDFTRNSSATRVNAQGLVEDVGNNLPRINYTNFDYENGEIVPYSGEGSLLLEPSRTNNLNYSEQFDNAYWVNNGVTINSNQIISPDGNLNADLLTGVSGGFGVVVFSKWSSTNNAASCFAKKGSSDIFRIANATGVIGGVNFDLDNGTVTNEDSGFNGQIENYGNGWFR